MPNKKLKDYLDQNHVKYSSINHAIAYTSQEIAASSHISGKEVAKTILIKINGEMNMFVLPANFRIDIDRIKEAYNTTDVEMATEQEFKNLFPDCEIGAMPPFGNLYHMSTTVATPLTEDSEIAFNAGTHTELLKLSYRDYEKLVKPKVANFAF